MKNIKDQIYRPVPATGMFARPGAQVIRPIGIDWLAFQTYVIPWYEKR